MPHCFRKTGGGNYFVLSGKLFFKSQIAEQQELIEELKDLISQDSHSEELETARQEISVKNKEIRQLNKDLKKKTNLVGSMQDKLSEQNQGYKSYLGIYLKLFFLHSPKGRGRTL